MAFGGGVSNVGSLTVSSSTIANNTSATSGGGIFNFGTIGNMDNTIVADNTAGGMPDDVSNPFGSPIVSGGFNLVEADLASAFTAMGDITGMDPMLDPDGLADNDGPTQTIALLEGSPAIDAGGGATQATDQRGFDRDAMPDIGAFEFVPADPLIVTNLNDSGPGSLREAILAAIAGDTIDLTGISGEICLDERLPRVPRGVMIIGAENVTLNLNCMN
jgi:hypothetical protein